MQRGGDDLGLANELVVILQHLLVVLREAESWVDGKDVLYNPIAIEIYDNKGLSILQEVDSEEGALIVTRIKSKYFGAGWDNYLATRRGKKIKKAM